MAVKKPDFSGWATKAGLKCADGRVIMKGAFEHQDTAQVPLVWQHSHGEPGLILGHAILEARDEGVYAHGYFNNSAKAQEAKEAVAHRDIQFLSIYANHLTERAKQVFHGAIREVSLVIAGANPGAKIEFVALQHGDGTITEFEDQAIITTGDFLELAHSDEDDESDDTVEDDDSDESLEHADDSTGQEIYDSLNDEQKRLVHFMLGAVAEVADSVQHSDTESDASEDEESDETNTEGDLAHQEGTDMTRNVFEQNGTAGSARGAHLSHDDLAGIIADARETGSFKDAANKYALKHGIDNIEALFPEVKTLNTSPEMIQRRTEWVSAVLDGVKKSPVANVRTLMADITAEEARAKGYVKGNEKVEEVLVMLARTTSPTTIYKLQGLDRDDLLDITEYDIVNWLWAEMRLMVEEEVARAILVGDGRSALSKDKVKDPAGATDGKGIRSILHDADLFAIKAEIPANTSPRQAVKEMVRARSKYRGTGKPTLFVSDAWLTEVMLEEDRQGRALYETEQSLADKLRVSNIVTVDLLDEYPNLLGIMVSLTDYTVGANRGGELTRFDDFDIKFNKYEYLLETRLSGALTKPFSAVVVTRGEGTLATATPPSYNGSTKVITVPTVTGVNYLVDGDVVTGTVGPITSQTELEAEPKDGYYLATNSNRTWVYTP